MKQGAFRQNKTGFAPPPNFSKKISKNWRLAGSSRPFICIFPVIYQIKYLDHYKFVIFI